MFFKPKAEGTLSPKASQFPCLESGNRTCCCITIYIYIVSHATYYIVSTMFTYYILCNTYIYISCYNTLHYVILYCILYILYWIHLFCSLYYIYIVCVCVLLLWKWHGWTSCKDMGTTTLDCVIVKINSFP